jgi:hypothetical protein
MLWRNLLVARGSIGFVSQNLAADDYLMKAHELTSTWNMKLCVV